MVKWLAGSRDQQESHQTLNYKSSSEAVASSSADMLQYSEKQMQLNTASESV